MEGFWIGYLWAKTISDTSEIQATAYQPPNTPKGFLIRMFMFAIVVTIVTVIGQISQEKDIKAGQYMAVFLNFIILIQQGFEIAQYFNII